MNYAKLFLEIELALILEHRPTNVVVDLPLEAEQLDLSRQELAEHLQQMPQCVCLEQRLPELESHGNVGRHAECLPLR